VAKAQTLGVATAKAIESDKVPMELGENMVGESIINTLNQKAEAIPAATFNRFIGKPTGRRVTRLIANRATLKTITIVDRNT